MEHLCVEQAILNQVSCQDETSILLIGFLVFFSLKACTDPSCQERVLALERHFAQRYGVSAMWGAKQHLRCRDPPR